MNDTETPKPASLSVYTRSEGADASRRVAIDHTPFIIGRAPECDLPLDDETVSRTHARIEQTLYGVYTIEDLSRNGTRRNSTPIKGKTALNAGDVLEFGSILAVFEDPYATTVTSREETGIGPILVDSSRREVLANSQVVTLSRIQFLIIELLFKHRDSVVSRDQIAEYVWDNEDHETISDDMIHVSIHRLRKRLAEYGVEKHIRTSKGFGYMYATRLKNE